MPRRKSKNPSSCPRGKKLVKIGARRFCAKTGGKKSGSRKSKRSTGWAKRMKASCERMSATKFNKVRPLCMAAGAKAPKKGKR
jgi:hypothetical protein